MTDTTHVLGGIRVVELADWVAVPAAGTMLADFGAEVIKVESPDGGDKHRQFHTLGGMPRSEIPYPWLLDGRSKRSLALDLKHGDGLSVLHDLLKGADVLLTSYRPPALAKLRLGYEDLRKINPRLIYALGTGFGEMGPDVEKPGYDVVTFWSRTGLEATLFPLEGWLGPIPPGIGDHSSAAILFGGVMLALYARARTGKGQKISMSLLANGVWANSILVQGQLAGAEFPERVPRESYPHFTSAYYRARDGRIFRIAAFADHHFPPLCRAVGRPDLIEDPRFAVLEERNNHMPELIAILDEVFDGHDVAHWQAAFEEHDVSYTLIADYEEVASDPQLEASRVFIEVDHPVFGRVRTIDSPLALQGQEKVAPRPAPALGEHTREVLTEMGYSAERIDDLLARGVAVQGGAQPGSHAIRGGGQR